ncbi:MAG: DUF2149 domain-containing protein [Planctomycetota bacterium]
MRNRRFNVLGDEDSDPMLSSVNLVDVFMVAMVVMAISLLGNPVFRMQQDDYTIIHNPGEPTMEITVKEGQRLTRFRATGRSSQGNGVEAGTAYQLQDGTMVYVPSDRFGSPEDEAAESNP